MKQFKSITEAINHYKEMGFYIINANPNGSYYRLESESVPPKMVTVEFERMGCVIGKEYIADASINNWAPIKNI